MLSTKGAEMVLLNLRIIKQLFVAEDESLPPSLLSLETQMENVIRIRTLEGTADTRVA